MAGSRHFVWLSVFVCAACGRMGLRSLEPVPSPVASVVAAADARAATSHADVRPAVSGPALEDPESAEPEYVEPEIEVPAVDIPPASWDIEVTPYETHERVAYFVGRFSGGAKASFEIAMERQSRYAPMIHERLRAGGLPEDMIYLSLIESWYDPHAYSRAAAVGMWQFMTGTARGVGLRVDWWIDQRRDPVRSTEAAVVFLNQLRDSFGSVYLAAAAYNGGPGRVSRGLNTHASSLQDAQGEDQFFALAQQRGALHAETRDYVPKLIAAALVGKEPLRYDVSVRRVEPFTWDSVAVPANTPLTAVAKVLGVSLDTLLDYNHHVLRGMTPPTGSASWLWVPTGTAAGFAEGLAALPVAERTATKRVVSKDGDFVAKIARAHGLTAKELNWYNPRVTRLPNGNLHAGQTILVPRRDVVAAARDVPDPSIERYGTSTTGTHVVKAGESLGVIARRNGTTVARLKELNGLRSDVIRVGQRLRVR